MKSKLIENIDDETWKKFTGYCKMNGAKVGETLNDILLTFLNDNIKLINNSKVNTKNPIMKLIKQRRRGYK